MRKKLWITIDTEMDADVYWHKSWPPNYSSVIEGIPQFLRPIWNKYNVHPIYFVSPEVLYDERCVVVLKNEIAQGAIIGAHLHPEYIEPQKCWGPEIEKIHAQFPCCDCTDEMEELKLINLTNLIEKKLGVRPTWYRAARFGADTATINMLRKLGYQYDCSLTPHIDWTPQGGPNHRNSPSERYVIAHDNIYLEEEANNEDIIQEIPVTIYGKRWGILGKLLPDNWLLYRWLRPTHMTYMELKSIINQLLREEKQEGCMMFHSMEIMINKTPYVRNILMQKYYLWRIKSIVGYAVTKGFEV